MRIVSPRTLTTVALAGALAAPTLFTGSPVVAAEQPMTLASAYASMDANTSNLQNEASSLAAQASEVNAEIAKLEAESAALTPIIQTKQQTLMLSLKEAYMNGKTSSLQVVVSNGGLSDMLNQQHYQDQVGDKAKRAAADLSATKQELDSKIAESTKKRDGLVALQAQTEEKLATAQAQAAARAALEAATRNNEAEFQKIRAAAAEEEAAALVTSPSAAPSPGSSATPRPGNNGGGNPGFSGRSNPYPYGQCTWYVYDQTGRGQNGNAGTWRATSSTPAVGKIMIWSAGEQGAGSAGHVGLVVGVNGSTVTIRHMNWNGWGVVSTGTFRSTGKFY